MKKYVIILLAIAELVCAGSASAQAYMDKYARKFVLADPSAVPLTVTLQAPNSGLVPYTLFLPTGLPLVPSFLSTDALGNLSWVNPSALSVSVTGENYLSQAGLVITAHPIDLTGSNVTGQLKAASFPVLTGDVTTTGGSLATTISNNAVTYAKMQAMTANKLLGSGATGTSVAEITLGPGLIYAGTTLNVVGASPTGGAGGDLAGSFPTPTIANTSGAGADIISALTTNAGTLTNNTTGSAAKLTTPRLLAGNSFDGSADVPFANKFIVQGTADAGLTGAQFLGTLASGIVKNTTSTGVLSIATPGTDYTLLSGLTPNGALYATAANNITSTGAMADGQLLIGKTGGTPALANLTAGSGISITNGANSIVIASTALSSGNGVQYDIAGSQATAAQANYLFNVAYNPTQSGNTSLQGGLITSTATSGNSDATGLTIAATSHNHGNSIGLSVIAAQGSGGTGAIYSGLFNGGNFGIGTLTPNQTFEVAGTAGTPNVRFGSLGSVATGSKIISANNNGDLSALAIPGSTGVLSTTNTGVLSWGTLPAAAFPALTGDVTTSAGSLATTLATIGAATGPIGNGTTVPVVTIDAKGRVTALTSTPITGAAPTGAASGDLAGNYPSPTIAATAGAGNDIITALNLGTVNTLNAGILKHDATLAVTTNQLGINLANANTWTAAQAFPALSLTGTELANSTVTYGKIQNAVANNIVLGNIAGANQPYTELTSANLKTLLNLTGTNSGDVTLAGQNYLSIAAGQIITANPVDLTGTNITGQLKAASFPILSGDITTTGGSLATTLATIGAATGPIGNGTTVPVITIDAKGRVTALTSTAITAGLSATTGVEYNLASPQNTATTTGGNYLFNVAYGTTNAAAANGAAISSVTTFANSAATGLSLTTTATGTATAKGLVLATSGGAANIDITSPDASAGTALTIQPGGATNAINNGGTLNLKGGNGGSTTGGGGIVAITGGTPGTTGTGGALNLSGGPGGSTSGTGGAVNISGGTTSNGTGGATTIQGGNGTGNTGGALTLLAGNSGTGSGTTASLTGGAAGAAGTGGSVTVAGGSGGSNSGAGGTANLLGGNAPGGTTGGAGGAVAITAGAAAGTTGGIGGAVTITAGAAAGTNLGGGITLNAGTGAGLGAAGNGGAIAMTAGTAGSSTSSGGAVTITGGSANTTGTGGAVTVAGGLSPSGTGGAVTLRGGDPTSGSGGAATLRGGNAATSGTGGSVAISAGTSAGTNNGNGITLTAANGSTTGTGGGITLNAGTGAGISQTGGAVTLQAGQGGATTSTGGAVAITAGNGGSTSGNGGAANFAAGDATSGTGGAINISGGDGAGTNQNGGGITLNAGSASGTGASSILFQTATAGTTGVTARPSATHLTLDGTGNLTLNNGAAQLQLTSSSGAGLSTFQTGAQGANIFNYTLPATSPSSGQVLTVTNNPGATSPFPVTLAWVTPSNSSNMVQYLPASTQATQAPGSGFLFDVAYSNGSALFDAAGARISSTLTNGSGTQTATALTLSSSAGSTVSNNAKGLVLTSTATSGGTSTGASITNTSSGATGVANGLTISNTAGAGTSTGLSVTSTSTGTVANTGASITATSTGNNTTTGLLISTNNSGFPTAPVPHIKLTSSQAADSSAIVTTDLKEIYHEQTGDLYGSTRLRIQNRTGSNGAIFQTISNATHLGTDLVDFGFIPGAGVQSNIRLEARDSSEATNPTNYIRSALNKSAGSSYHEEFQFMFGTTQTTPVNVLDIGDSATLLERGNFGLGYTGTFGIGSVGSPLEKLDVHSVKTAANIILSDTGTAAHAAIPGSLKFQGVHDGISSFVAGDQASTYINYTWPTSQPTATNQVLTSAALPGGLGTSASPYTVALSWATPSGGSFALPYTNSLSNTTSTLFSITNTNNTSNATGVANFVLSGANSTADVLTVSTSGTGNAITATGDVEIKSGTTASELHLYEPNGSGSNYTGFKAQAQSGNIVYTLPATTSGTSTGDVLSISSGANTTTPTLSWTTPSTGSSSGALIRAPQVLTSGTSYTTPSGCNTIIVELVGAGGGGGGVNSSNAHVGAGGGGAAGGYARKTFTVSGSTAYTYAIGGAGTGGAAGNNGGNTGGNTTFTVGATTVTAHGGSGGSGMNASNAAIFNAGGSVTAISTNGDINSGGMAGEFGMVLSSSVGKSGAGGSGPFGSGGNSQTGSSADGIDGVGRGAGGGGGLCFGTTDHAGGDGTGGVIIIWEFY